VSVHPCRQVEFEAAVTRFDLVDDFAVMEFTRNSDRPGESKICSVDSDDCSIEPFEPFALNTALVIQLGRMEQFKEDTNDRDYRAVVRMPGEDRSSYFLELVMRGCLLGKFSERGRRIDSFEDADLEMVLKIVFIGVGADIELIGDELAVDCIEQRVKFTRSSQ
jgi:hypothetical protein